jgi:hypothetical protein
MERFFYGQPCCCAIYSLSEVGDESKLGVSRLWTLSAQVYIWYATACVQIVFLISAMQYVGAKVGIFSIRCKETDAAEES